MCSIRQASARPAETGQLSYGHLTAKDSKFQTTSNNNQIIINIQFSKILGFGI